MLNNISWGSYWSVLTALLIFYYAFVLLKYYRSDLRFLFQPAPPITGHESQDENGDDELLPAVKALTDEATAFLEQAAYAKPVKAEIILALQQIAKKYKAIKNSSYQPAICSLIKREAKDKCGVHLSNGDIRQVWVV